MNALRNFLIALLISLIVFIPCAVLIKNSLIDSASDMFNGNKTPDSSIVTDSSVSSEVTQPTHPIEDDIKGESFNILLIGTDYNPELLLGYHPEVKKEYPTFENSEKLIGEGKMPEYAYRSVNADAIMLVCVNKELQTIAYLPIPSNMKLSIGTVDTTAGELYYQKGLTYFVDKMSQITGVPIDYYALTSVSQIASVVDTMGAVTFNVPCDMEYEDDTSGYKISLLAGAQSIDGEKAAALLSYNSYTTESLTRESVSLDFLKALALKMTNIVNINKSAEVFSSVDDYIYTNFTAKDLTDNVELIFAYSRFNIVPLKYPGSYYYSNGKKIFNPLITRAIATMEEYKY